ncbi:SDR family NAD(P)-dependent oxidoreductase [Streptomyces sp. NBC_00459]|uniref:SDR family NAD(P)-dependent oxidoreductase n=1 Tax=Streptomyces sp. NBC_00459 TaxID=2975749 RepID=UPI002E195C46
MRKLQNKVVFVAGAATGPGAASARRLAQEDARAVLGDLNADGAEETVADIRAGGDDAVALEFDTSDNASVGRLVPTAVGTYGGLDAVHANAGDMGAVQKDTDVTDIDLAIRDRTIAVNLRGHMPVSRHAVPELIARGDAIAYTSSIASFTGDPQRPANAVTEAGINALARHVASRWSKEGIRANAVAPGPILTPEIEEGAPPETLRAMLARNRGTRHGRAEDAAGMVTCLVSDEGARINGQVLTVDGGTVLR